MVSRIFIIPFSRVLQFLWSRNDQLFMKKCFVDTLRGDGDHHHHHYYYNDDDDDEFFTPVKTDCFFHWSLSDNVVIWMISILFLVSSSPSLFSRPLETVPRLLLQLVSPTSCSTAFFFNPLVWSRYWNIFSFSFIFTLQSSRTVKSTSFLLAN